MMSIGAKHFVSYLFDVDSVQPPYLCSDHHTACLNLHKSAFAEHPSCDADHALIPHSVDRLSMRQFSTVVDLNGKHANDGHECRSL